MRSRITRCIVIALATLVINSCSYVEESRIRATIHDCFDAAKRGDIESALAYTSPRAVSNRQLEGASRSEWLAELGSLARESLQDSRLEIEQISVSGDRAIAQVSVITGDDRQKSTIAVIRSGDRWLLERLPVALIVS